MHYLTMSTLTAALLLFTGPSAWAQGDNAGLKHLHGFTALERMNVGDTKVTKAGVQELSRVLPNAKISR